MLENVRSPVPSSSLLVHNIADKYDGRISIAVLCKFEKAKVKCYFLSNARKIRLWARNVSVKARPSVVDLKGSINKCSNKANFVQWSSETKVIS